jgi:hypothetical protein
VTHHFYIPNMFRVELLLLLLPANLFQTLYHCTATAAISIVTATTAAAAVTITAGVLVSAAIAQR